MMIPSMRGSGGNLYFARPTATPQDILGANLVGFIDAEDNSRITNVSGAVSAYSDLISSSSYAQGTAASRPSITTNAITGRQIFRFDGVDDYLEFTGIPTGYPTGANAGETIFVGAQSLTVATSSTSRTIVIWGAAANTTNRQLRRQTTGARNVVVQRAGNGSTDLVSGDSPGDFFGNSFARGIVTATDIQSDLNAAIGATAACVSSTGSTRLRIGTNNSASPGGFFLGDLSALLVTNAVLTEAQLNAIAVWAGPRVWG